jgi:hypothetical protein
MAAADYFALEADGIAKSYIQAVRQHDQSRLNNISSRRRHRLPIGARCQCCRFGMDDAHARRNFGSDRIDQVLVIYALLIAGTFFDHASETYHPIFAIRRCRPQHGLQQAGLFEGRDLRAIELFAAKIRRILRVRVDQHGVNAGTPKHRGSERARKSAADNRHLCLADAGGRLGLARWCQCDCRVVSGSLYHHPALSA